MGLFDLFFEKSIEEGIKIGIEEGLTGAFSSEKIQLAYDKLIQTGYNLGRSDEKNGAPYRDFTKERHTREGKQ